MRNTMQYVLMSLLALLVVTCAADAEPLDEAMYQAKQAKRAPQSASG